MTGQRLSGRGIMKNWEERTVIFLLDIFLVLEFGFGGWVNCGRGHQVAGSFRLGGQESSQNPRAKEPDRLLLAS
jgi:hypothetical protein